MPEVAELTWILNCVAPVPMLENAHSYKDKLARGMVPSAGLFDYSVLMAADILIYDSDVVPVGRDQKQHLEMTRDLAAKFNQRYGGEILKLPKALIREDVAVVPGLDGQKMSKSYRNDIPVFEDEKPLRRKIMSIVTDSTPVESPKDPAASTIMDFFRLVASPVGTEAGPRPAPGAPLSVGCRTVPRMSTPPQPPPFPQPNACRSPCALLTSAVFSPPLRSLPDADAARGAPRVRELP